MRCPKQNRPSVRLALALLLVAWPAHATYSIVATDAKTQQIGGAVTSCVGAQSVATVLGPAPGHGGIHAQAAQSIAGRNQGVALLNMGVDPAEIIRQITAAAFDPNARTRQYGVADLSGRAAGFTGAGAQDYKEDRQATFDTYTYSVQGNILTGQAVLDQAEASFRSRGCDLADKLMLALEAGAENGQGDSRCTTRNIPSDSASIEVDLTGVPAGSYLRLSLSGTMNVSPLLRLRAMFDAWRTTHPCASTDAGADAGADAGGQRDAASDAGRLFEGGDGPAGTAEAGNREGAGAGGAGASGEDGSGGLAGSGDARPIGEGGGVANGFDAATEPTGVDTDASRVGDDENPVTAASDSGCTCRASARERGSRALSWSVGLALVGAAALRRRRGQSSSKPFTGTPVSRSRKSFWAWRS